MAIKTMYSINNIYIYIYIYINVVLCLSYAWFDYLEYRMFQSLPLSGEMRSRTQVQRKSGFFITKPNKEQKPPRRGKTSRQAGRQKTGAQSAVKHSHDIRQRISTGLLTHGDYIGRQTRVTKETQLEPLKQ